MTPDDLLTAVGGTAGIAALVGALSAVIVNRRRAQADAVKAAGEAVASVAPMWQAQFERLANEVAALAVKLDEATARIDAATTHLERLIARTPDPDAIAAKKALRGQSTPRPAKGA